MGIDFNKLLDPEFSAEVRRELDAEAAALVAKEVELRKVLEACWLGLEELNEQERSFVRSCRARLNSHLLLSGPQEKWLLDLSGRFGSAP